MVIAMIPVYIEISNDWPTTDGIVISSEVKGATEGTRKPEITFTYIINDTEYISNQIYTHSGSYSSTGSYAQDMVNKYTVRKNITIFYNLLNPSKSAIEKGQIHPLFYFVFFMGTIVFITSLWFFYKSD